MSEWTAYVAGLFDGEGWVSIARVRVGERSDYHKMVVGISQRAKHREALDRICAEFGGSVLLATEKTRVAERWATQAKWQLQDKPGMERFLSAIAPYVIIKARPVQIGLEFIQSFQKGAFRRDSLGHIRGRSLDRTEIERRERLRLAMRDANELGPPRAKPSTLPPLDLQHRDSADAELVGNPATVQRGVQRYNARFAEETIRSMRAEYAAGSVTQAELAERHNVSLMTVNKIIHRQTWKHVT